MYHLWSWCGASIHDPSALGNDQYVFLVKVNLIILFHVFQYLSAGRSCIGQCSELLRSRSFIPCSTFPVSLVPSPVVMSDRLTACRYNLQLLKIWRSSLERSGYVVITLSMMFQSFRRYSLGVWIGPCSRMLCFQRNSHNYLIQEFGSRISYS